MLHFTWQIYCLIGIPHLIFTLSKLAFSSKLIREITLAVLLILWVGRAWYQTWNLGVCRLMFFYPIVLLKYKQVLETSRHCFAVLNVLIFKDLTIKSLHVYTLNRVKTKIGLDFNCSGSKKQRFVIILRCNQEICLITNYSLTFWWLLYQNTGNSMKLISKATFQNMLYFFHICRLQLFH